VVLNRQVPQQQARKTDCVNETDSSKCASRRPWALVRAGLELEQGAEFSIPHLQQQVDDMGAALSAAAAAEREAHTAAVRADAALAATQHALQGQTNAAADSERLADGATCPVCQQAVAEGHTAAVHAEIKARIQLLSDEAWAKHDAAETARRKCEASQAHLAAVQGHYVRAEAQLNVRTLHLMFLMKCWLCECALEQISTVQQATLVTLR
jgi:hypothetical protein